VAKAINAKTVQQLYRAATVAKKLDVTVTTVWRYVDQGILPQPMTLSAGCKVFESQKIEEYIESVMAQAVCNG
jgi:predicted DNA-binding transcriptional regulator AlpA